MMEVVEQKNKAQTPVTSTETRERASRDQLNNSKNVSADRGSVGDLFYGYTVREKREFFEIRERMRQEESSNVKSCVAKNCPESSGKGVGIA